MANNWSKDEVEAAVMDYFSMLRIELSGQTYNKSAHRRTLLKKLNDRSDGSVELKHQNISAVLIEMGLPYINGYKPRSNYQRLILPEVISDYLSDNSDIFSLFKQDADAVSEVPTVDNILNALESPPKPDEAPEKTQVNEAPVSRIVNNINYIEREARNQSLGDAGEQFVINFEKARLIRAGRDALADKIEHVAQTQGPSAGFDILSFEEDGSDRFIEAKTTKYGKNTPFFVTPNELRFSTQNQSSYHLYRVFSFRSAPKLFSLRGSIERNFELTASEFRARVY